jgi:Methyltransferase domain
MIPILDKVQWQMAPGERAALEGILSQLQPELAVEIGTAEGGSLRCIAGHSTRVLSFDLTAPPLAEDELRNVTVHTGDSHVLLPKVLADLAREGLNVDFVLVDGDHTAAGVEQDARDLLASDAVKSTVIVFHDTMNDEVRAGLERIDVAAEPKIAHFDLEFVAGRLNYGGVFHHQLWGGFGLMVVDANRDHGDTEESGDRGYTLFELVAPVRDALVAREQMGGPTGPGIVRSALSSIPDDGSELVDVQAELARAHVRYDEIRNSKSWRFTAPLRAAKKILRTSR